LFEPVPDLPAVVLEALPQAATIKGTTPSNNIVRMTGPRLHLLSGRVTGKPDRSTVSLPPVAVLLKLLIGPYPVGPK
jgi:hypothetical protein